MSLINIILYDNNPIYMKHPKIKNKLYEWDGGVKLLKLETRINRMKIII